MLEIIIGYTAGLLVCNTSKESFVEEKILRYVSGHSVTAKPEIGNDICDIPSVPTEQDG